MLADVLPPELGARVRVAGQTPSCNTQVRTTTTTTTTTTTRLVLTSGRNWPRTSSSSTPGAYGVLSSLEEPVQEKKKEEHQVSPMPDSVEWVQLSDDKGRTYFWNRRTRATRWKPPPGIRVVWVGERTGERGLVLAQGHPCQCI